MIATYTAIDRIGTREIDVFTYAAILWLTCSVVLVGWVALVAGGDLLRYGPEASRRAAVGGILTLAAYLCILVALSVAPLSGVAPLRESATVFAAAWGSVRMGEAGDPREAVRRIGASVLIVGGALLLAVGELGGGRDPHGRLDRRHATEHPAPAEPAVDQPDAGDHERGPEHDPRVDGLLEDEVAERDPDDRDEVGDQRRPRRAPVREQPEDRQVGETRAEDAEPQDGEDRLGVRAWPSTGARTGARRCR